MNHTISTSEFRKQAADIIDEVHRGKTYVIVRNGKPVAKLVPADAHTDLSPDFAKVVSETFVTYADDLKRLAETP